MARKKGRGGDDASPPGQEASPPSSEQPTCPPPTPSSPQQDRQDKQQREQQQQKQGGAAGAPAEPANLKKAHSVETDVFADEKVHAPTPPTPPEEQQRREVEAKAILEGLKEAERKRLEEEEAERKRQAEEEERKRREAKEAERKRQAEEAERKRQEEEAERQKQQEEAERRKQEEEAERRKQEEEAEKKRQAEEAERKRHAEEAERKRQEEEAERRKQEEEAERRKQEEEAEKKRQAEEAERKRQEEEDAERRKQEEEAEKKTQEEEAEKKRQEEEAEERQRQKEAADVTGVAAPATDPSPPAIVIQRAEDAKRAIDKALSLMRGEEIQEESNTETESEEDVDDPLLQQLTPEQRVLVCKLQGAQKEVEEIEAQFDQEVEFLRYQYEKRLQPLYKKRSAMLASPPKDSAAAATAAAAAGAVGAAAAEAAAAAAASAAEVESFGTPGLPGFWLGVLEKERHIRYAINDGDRAALLYLRDIQVEKRLRRADGFKIFFFFSENPFFCNGVLTKEFLMRHDGADVVVRQTLGTEILWREGMDLTKSISISKQRNIRTKEQRIVQRIKEEKSFFRFFEFTQVPALKALKVMGDEEAEELFQRLASEYDIAVALRDLVVPKAINLFLGIQEAESEESSSEEE